MLCQDGLTRRSQTLIAMEHKMKRKQTQKKARGPNHTLSCFSNNMEGRTPTERLKYDKYTSVILFTVFIDAGVAKSRRG